MPAFICRTKIADIMERTYEIIQVGEETSNGNQIVKFKGDNVVSTPFGEKAVTETYYVAVKAGKVIVNVGDEVQLDITANYRVIERPFVDENGDLPIGDNGEPICDEDGNPLMLKWLSVR
jgi:hypothetical protein